MIYYKQTSVILALLLKEVHNLHNTEYLIWLRWNRKKAHIYIQTAVLSKDSQ